MNINDYSKIEEIVSEYKYGRFNLLEKPFSITLLKKEIPNSSINKTSYGGDILITPFYNDEDYSKQGTCAELAYDCIHNLNKEFGNKYQIGFAQGRDPDYFFSRDSIHYFNVLFEEDIFKDQKEYCNMNYLNRVLINTDPIIIDPSFGKIKRFSESGYDIRCFCHEDNIEYEKPPELILKHKQGGRPIYLDSDGDVSSIWRNKTNLSIGFRSPRKNIYIYDLNDPYLTRIVNDKEQTVKDFVQIFREQEDNWNYEL